MKKHLLIGLLLLLSINMIAQTSNNKYEAEWKQVATHERNDLPQSAMQTVNAILEKAIASKNNTQVIKALIYKNKYKRQIDNNDNKGIFTDLQALANEATSDKGLISKTHNSSYSSI